MVMLILSTLLGLLIFNSNNAISGTVINDITYASDMTWNIGGSPYWLEGNVTISYGANLTIEEGVEVRFNGSYSIYVNGNITAVGTSADMINFTSNQTTTSESWDRIQVNPTGYAKIRYCNITYGKYGIYLNGSSNNNIMDNNISENFDGLYLYMSSNNTIINNTISDNVNRGIFLSGSSGNDILNNNISNNLFDGIWLTKVLTTRSSNNNIINNTIWNNIFGAGLYAAESEYNNITLNHLFSNKYGIRLQSLARNNNITKNNISENTVCGVNLTSSSDNRIYHNIFWNNSAQAYDDTSDNFWDSGYPSGGNFWSDFDEPGEGAYDDYSGPSQTEDGSDGIVDTNYTNIGGGAGVVDNYPLISSSLKRIYVYLNSPINNSAMKPGTVLDFEVVGDDIVNVSYSVNGTPKGDLSTPYDINGTETGTWSDGIVTIDIFVYDSEGNITEFWFNVTIDSVFPEIVLISPPNGSLILPSVDIDLTVTDDNLHNVTFVLDGGSNTTLLTPYDIDTTSWSDGNRTVQVWARDKAGNINTTAYNFTIDGIRPLIALLSPTNESVIQPGTWLRFDITDPHLNPAAVNYSNGTGPYLFPEPYNITTTGWADGDHKVEVNASDILGNMRTRFYNFTIDSIPPFIFLVSPSNNSVIQAGEILDFAVWDDNLDEVTYLRNFIGPYNLDPPDFDVDTTDWPDGPYRIDIYATDLAGHINSTFYNFTVATPPMIILNSPLNNSVIKEGAVINISIIDTNLDQVNYSKNAVTDISFDFVSSPYHYIVTTGWLDGNYTIQVYANDTAGNTDSRWYNFTIDNTPPSIDLNSPQNNSVVPPGTNLDFHVSDDNLLSANYSLDGGPPNPFSTPYDIDTTDTMIWTDDIHTVNISASDVVGNNITRVYYFTIDSIPPLIVLNSPSNNSLISAGTTLDFTVSDVNLNFSTHSENGGLPQPLAPPYDIDTTSWDGDYIIEVYAEDLAGHNTTRWFNFTVDGILPTITLNSPENNSYKQPGVILDFDVFDQRLLGVNYSKNAQPFVVLLPPYDIPTSGWGDGIYNISIKAVDAVGNENISEYVFILDSTPPVIQLLSPPNGTSNEIGTPINLSIIEDNLDFVNYSVTSGENQTLLFPFDINTANFPDGDCTVVVYAIDLAGNFNITWYDFIFNDTTEPTITLISPQNLSFIPAGTIIDLYIFDLHLSNVNYSLDYGVDVPFWPPYDINTSNWDEGAHTLVVHANDTKNNMNTSTFIFTIDSMEPSILLISPLNNSVILPGEFLDFNIVDDNLDIVNYSRNGEDPITFTTPFNIGTVDWGDGSYTILILAKDKAGNENVSLFGFIIDSVSPTISLNSPVNGSLIQTGTIIDITVSDANLDNVEYSINDGLPATLSSPYDIDTSDWADGSYVIEIHASDPAGNTMGASFTFTLDGTQPEISRILVAEPYYPFENTMIVIGFTEPMNRSSVISALNITPSLNYTLEWSEDGRTLYLGNFEGMQLNQSYTVKFDDGVVDLAGNALVPYEDYEFFATVGVDEGDIGEEEPSVLRFWWIIPILIAMLVIAIILFFLLMRERKEEPKGPVEEVEDMFLKIRAKEDIDAMESILSLQEQFGDRLDEANIMFQEAKKAFENGDYNAVTVYERTMRDMVLEGPIEE